MTFDIFEDKGNERMVTSPTHPFIWRGRGGDAYGKVPRDWPLCGEPELCVKQRGGTHNLGGERKPWPRAKKCGARLKSCASKMGSLYGL